MKRGVNRTSPMAHGNPWGGYAAVNQQLVMIEMPEPRFADITRLAAQVCNAPAAALCLGNGARHWFKAQFGMSIPDDAQNHVVCSRTICSGAMVEVADTTIEPVLAQHPLVTNQPLLRFIVSVPIQITSGDVIGALSVFDVRPRRLTPLQLTSLECVALQAGALVEHRLASEELNLLRRVYQIVVQGARDGFWLADLQGQLLEVNDAYCSLSGYSREQLLKMRISDLEADESAEQIQLRIKRAMTEGAHRFETRHRRADGTLIEVETSMNYTPYEGGRIFAFIRDITARGAARARIEHFNQLLHACHGINRLIIRESETETLLQRVCETLAQNRGYRLVWAVRVRPGNNLFTVGLAGEAQDYIRGLEHPLTQDFAEAKLLQAVTESAQLFICQDLTNEPTFADRLDLLQAHKLAAVAGIPLKLGGDVFGVLMIYADHVNAFDGEELELLVEVAADIGYALQNIKREWDRKRAEAELQRLSTAVEQAAEAIVITDITGAIQYVNPAFERITGYLRSEVIGRNPRILKSGKHDPEFYAQLWATINAGKVWTGCFTNKRKDGSFYEEQATIAPVRDDSGQIVHFIAVKEDVTSQKAAENALKESQRRLATLISNLPGMVYRCKNDVHWTMEFVSEGSVAVTEFDPTDLVGNKRISYNEVILEQDREAVRDRIETALAQKQPFEITYRIRTAGGHIKWVLEQGRGVFDEQGMLQALEGYITDVTERKQAEAALAQEVHMRRILMDESRDGIVILDGKGKVVEANRKFAQMLGYSQDEIPHMHVWDWDTKWPRQQLLDKTNAADTVGDRFETCWRRKDGSALDVEISTNAAILHGEKYIFCVCRDITERKQMQEKLRMSEEHFRSLVENTSDIVAELNPDGTIFYLSPSAQRILGYDSAATVGVNVLEYVHPDDIERARNTFRVVVEFGASQVTENVRIRHADGSWRTFETKAKLETATHGPRRIIVNARDITERIALETRLHQMQRLESIGQLAAGVAHDFNNLLAVIQGHVHLLQSEVKVGSSALRSLKQIAHAAERGANLTRQLLLFARKQHVQPQTIDLNQVIARLASMLERLIGEHITLEFGYSAEPALVNADVGMIEQVLVNLAVNARDAMPNGGILKIITSFVGVDAQFPQPHPEASKGVHVRLSVSDTGHGISPEILPHIFEPFFTTKEPSKGTGLGLATVYGIVKQHNGWIEVDSRPGTGTTFHVYLPASKPKQTKLEQGAPPQISAGNNETVLLVEDEEGVREVSRTVLERTGYRVIEARCGPDALGIVAAQHKAIDVLVTDVVMPGGMNGFELAERLLTKFRHMRIVFTSGYSDTPDTSFLRRKGVRFLMKPYGAHELCRTIQECLREQF